MTTSGPLDLESLAQLRALPGNRGRSLADDAIDAFIHELPARLRVLREALAQADWRTGEHGAQALRGIAATLGARDVMRLAGELVDALSHASPSESAALLAELEQAGKLAMEALLKERGPTP